MNFLSLLLTDGCRWLPRLVPLLMATIVPLFASTTAAAPRPVLCVDLPSPTADKPQSKLWFARDTWWALLPTASGPSLWQRTSGGWQEHVAVRQALRGLPGRCDVWFDRDGATAVGVGPEKLAIYRLTPTADEATNWRAEKLAEWNTGTTSPLETATIARDKSGAWWVAAPVTRPGAESVTSQTNHKTKPARAVMVWHSADARQWTALPPLATGIGGDDICLVTALDEGVGVAWSDQNRDEVAFRLHRDGNPAEAWEPTEIVASGGKTADDHLHAAWAGGRLWLATKNSVDANGQPQLVLRERARGGAWQNHPYAPKRPGLTPSRPIVVSSPDGQKLILAQTNYTAKERGNQIVWSWLSVADTMIAPKFAPVIEPSPDGQAHVNDVTGPKAAFPDRGPWLLLASDDKGAVYEVDVRPLTDIPYTRVSPRVVTAPAPHDSDDPAFWFDPQNPERTLIIGTDKHHDGALLAYDLDGRIVRRAEGLQRPNNVDVIQNFSLGGKRVDLAVTTERERLRLRAFALPSLACVDGGDLVVFGGDAARAPMGIALYRRPRDGAVFVFVSGKSGPANGYLAQYRLQDDGTGKLCLTPVREFGRYSGRKEIESIAVDAELGYVYYSDETCGVRKYHADPDAPGASDELALFATAGFVSDHEGISIYKADERAGYILVSDQQADRFWIFRREGEPGRPHEHKPIKVVQVAAHESDGSDVAGRALGPQFPAGVFVAMSTDHTFHYYAWEDIAGDDLRVVPEAAPPVVRAGAQGLRFTVASDPHLQPDNYEKVLAAMQRHSGGMGAFQVLVGDLCDKPGQTPQTLRDRFERIFGHEHGWYAVVGNHDADVATTSAAMTWRRDEFNTGHGGRPALRMHEAVRPGPPGCEETTYSWDEGNAHFVVLNLYWNGETAPGSDAAGKGDIVPALLAWLEHDLAANKQPFVFVFGHEPAFPQTRHVGNSLDQYPEHRDAFWQLLSRHGVQAYFCGHVHSYSKVRRDGVWQICDGHSGRVKGGDRVYLDVMVGPAEAEVRTWIAAQENWTDWTLLDTIRVHASPVVPVARAKPEASQ